MRSDEQLIKKIKRRSDREAADELLQRYYRDIYAFIFRQVSHRETAMDLTQDTFVAVLRGLPSFDERKAAFRTWLYTIAGNKVTDYFRSRYHRQRLLEQEITDMEYLTLSEEEQPEEAVVRKIYENQMAEQAIGILEDYGSEWIRIFQLKIFGESTFGEIARMLGLSENTVKTRYIKITRRCSTCAIWPV